MLNETDKRLVLQFLRDYSDDRGDANCNDFDLKGAGVPECEWERIHRECAEANGSPEDHKPGYPRESYRNTFDFEVIDLMVKKLEAEWNLK